MSDIVSLHRKEYGSRPEVIFSAPGVISLLGELNDLNEGVMLQFALGRRVQVAVSKRKDSSLRFYAADFNERKRTTVANLKYKREDRWANYPKGVLAEIAEEGHKFKGLNFTIYGEIPQEIGLGSSSALCTATAYALRELYKYPFGDKECVELAMRAETAFIGKAGSISVFITSALAKGKNALHVDLRNLGYEYVPFRHKGVLLLLTISNVPKVSSEAEMQYRKDECGKCVAYLNKTSEGRVLRDYTVEDLKHSMGIVPENTRRLCMHIVEENRRVQEAKEALLNNDIGAFGKVLNKSHESLRDNYEISCPEIDWLVKRAWEMEEVIGSRLIGSGFGGSTITLLREEGLKGYNERLEEYERIFGFPADTIICEPSDGVRAVEVSG